MKYSIGLAVIVGNEESQIERFLSIWSGLTPRIHFTFATGTQKSDRTYLIIASSPQYECGGITIDRYHNKIALPHVDDFAAARNQTYKQLEAECDYIVWADVDDVLQAGTVEILKDEARKAEKDVYVVPYYVRNQNQIVFRERMTRNDGCAVWKYPIHELLTFTRDVTYRPLNSAGVIHEPVKEHLEKKHPHRNLNILAGEVNDKARMFFFAAMEYLERQSREFLPYADAALALPDLGVVERYELLLHKAQWSGEAKLSRQYVLEAFYCLPDRREALALLCCYAMADVEFDRANVLARHVLAIPKPKAHYWTLQHDWYGWKGIYLYAQTLRGLGKHEEALSFEREYVKPVFSLIHPTYKRPAQALATREEYLSKAADPLAVEYIFGIHHDDVESIKLLSGFRHVITDKEGVTPNTLAPLAESVGKFIMLVADDLIPPARWDEKIKNAVPDFEKPVVLNFADQLRSEGKEGDHICHPFFTRAWYEMAVKNDTWPGTGIYSDDEFMWRAKKAGVIVNAPSVVFDHQHYSNGKRPFDATYADQNQEKNYIEGLELLIARNPDHPKAIERRHHVERDTGGEEEKSGVLAV